MEKYCLIISGGEFDACPEEESRGASFVIACDKGWEYAARLHVRPDLVVGDFDSAAPPQDLPILRVPSRKDDTDTMLAMKKALEMGFEDIRVLCALGGRLDHTLANLQCGAYAVRQNPACRVGMRGEGTRCLIMGPGRVAISRRPGWSLSLFALSERCEGLCISGTKYDCSQVELVSHFPLGVSNYWKDCQALISFQRGILLIMQSQLQKGEHI